MLSSRTEWGSQISFLTEWLHIKRKHLNTNQGGKPVRHSLTPNQSASSVCCGTCDSMAEGLHSHSGENRPLRERTCRIQRNAAPGGVLPYRTLSTHPWPLLLLVICTFSFLSAETAHSVDKALPPAIASAGGSSTPMIVVGFVGGFVRPDDLRHSEVQLAQKLRAANPEHLRIATFENWHRKAAHRAILRWLDTDEDGNLSEAERRGARIVLYGHSWGGAAVISLARELERERIPVLLTVQVDSIAKPGQDDGVVPANVARAINFYQTRGFLHGRTRITAADPAHTEILGDFSFDYKQPPAECSQYPWLTRHLFPGHTSIECDPRVWSQIESLIDKYSFAGPAASMAGLR